MPSTIRGSDNFDSGLQLGKGQTWQNMLSPSVLRAVNNVYTNNTGGPIQLAISVAITSNGTGGMRLNGQTVADIGGTGATANSYGRVDMVIPNGATYELFSIPGTVTKWWELRP